MSRLLLACAGVSSVRCLSGAVWFDAVVSSLILYSAIKIALTMPSAA